MTKQRRSRLRALRDPIFPLGKSAPGPSARDASQEAPLVLISTLVDRPPCAGFGCARRHRRSEKPPPPNHETEKNAATTDQEVQTAAPPQSEKSQNPADPTRHSPTTKAASLPPF